MLEKEKNQPLITETGSSTGLTAGLTAAYTDDINSLNDIKPHVDHLREQHNMLPRMLPFYLNELKRFDASIVSFLTDEQKKQYGKTLKTTLFLLLERYNAYDLLARNDEDDNNNKTKKSIKDCIYKIGLLDLNIETAFNTSYACDLTTDSPLHLDKAIKIPSMLNLRASDVNNRRLDWLWTKTFIDSSLAKPFFPDPFHRVPKAQADLLVAGNIGGMLSWSVYAVRFILRFYLLFALTFRGKGSDDNEISKVPRWEMFKIHFNMLKFGLLNDFAWGIANGLTYFWLNGPGKLGIYGGIVNTALFGMDFVVSILMYVEAAVAYKRDYGVIKLAWKNTIDTTQRRDLAVVLHSMEFNRKYERAGLLLNIGYALSIAIALFIISGVVMAAASSLALMTGIACLPLSIAYAMLSKSIEICKTAALKRERTLQIEVLLAYYDAVHTEKSIEVTENVSNKQTTEVIRILKASNLLSSLNPLNGEAKEKTEQYLFHLIRNNLSERNLYHDTLKYQRIKLVFTVMTQLIVPAAFFMTYMLLPPLGLLNLLVLAAALLVTWLAHIALDKNLKDPKEKAIAQTDFKQENNGFENRSLAFVNEHRHGLFGKINLSRVEEKLQPYVVAN